VWQRPEKAEPECEMSAMLPRSEPGRRREAAYAQAVLQIVEAHAVAAHLQAGGARHGGDTGG